MPYVVWTEVRGEVVEVRVRLFGFAAFHGAVVLSALCAAMDGGVSIRNHGVRTRFAVLAARIERFSGTTRAWRDDASVALLTLLTPLIIRRGQVIRISPASLLRSAARRAGALAPWMHCRPEQDIEALVARGESLMFDMSGIHAERWWRTSRRNPGLALPMEGYAGRVRIEGALGPWATYLDLAGFTHLGGECALGCGAVRATFL